MLTGSPQRKANRAGFLESDRIRTLDLPQDGRWVLGIYLRVLQNTDMSCPRPFSPTAAGSRTMGNRTFCDYHPDTMLIRVWMRTAVRKEVTSFGTFLSTLCHEFCHHLDFQLFGFSDSWHIRGFYERAAVLYHHARDTAPKKLVWVPMTGGRWRIDWAGTNRDRQ